MIILFAEHEEERIDQVQELGDEVGIAQVDHQPEFGRVVLLVRALAAPGFLAEVGEPKADQKAETVDEHHEAIVHDHRLAQIVGLSVFHVGRQHFQGKRQIDKDYEYHFPRAAAADQRELVGLPIGGLLPGIVIQILNGRLQFGR